MKTFHRVLACLFSVSFLLSSCNPASFKYPLSSIKNAKIDKRLEGLWSSNDNSNNYLFFRSKSNNLMDVVWLDGRDKEKGIKVFKFEAFQTHSVHSNYLNIKTIYSHDEFNNNKYTENYIIAKYTIKRENLFISFLDATCFKEAIEKGILKGTIEGKNLLKEHILVTDTTEKVLEFIESLKNENLFESFGEYHKIYD